MKKLLIVALLLCGSAFAASDLKKPNFAPVPWTSPDPMHGVKIDNSYNLQLKIFIAVEAEYPDQGGVNITNCGSITHIDAGSSAVCLNRDGDHPVTFSSDGKAARGVYEVDNQ